MATQPTVNLQRQYGIMDTIIYPRGGNTKYWYNGYTQEKLKFKEFKDILPTIQPVVQGTVPSDFTIPIFADKLGPVQLQWTQSALAVTGGTYAAYSDYLALAAINRIEIIFGSNIVYTHYPLKKFWNIQKKLTEEKKDIELAMVAGDLTLAQRIALAANAQDLIYDIPLPFTMSPDRYQELRQLAIQPIIRVHWNSPSAFVETDGTVPVTSVTNPKLTMYTIHLEPEERSMNNEVCESNHGIVRLSEESKVEFTTTSTNVPAATVGEWQIELKNYKNSLRFLAFTLRAATDLTTANLSRPYEVSRMRGATSATPNVPELRRWRLVTGGGEILLDWQYTKHQLLYQHKMYFNSPAGAPIFGWYWDDNPTDELNTHGAFNFQSVLNPILVLDFAVAPAVDLNVQILASQWQMIQTVRGEIAPQFA
jgi:hypothetical protein